MSVEEYKAIVRRFYAEADKKIFDPTVVRQLPAPNFVAHMPGVPQLLNAEQFIEFTKAFAAGFPDYTHTIEDEIVEGDKFVVRVTWHGTHTGTFQGIPPTGKHATMGGINILRFENGRIAEMQGQFDALGLMQQLGVIPAAA